MSDLRGVGGVEAAAAAGFPLATRLFLAPLLAIGAGVIGMVAHSFIHSGLEDPQPMQVGHNSPLLMISAGAGALVGAVLAWGVLGRNPRAIWIGAAAGALPTLLTCGSCLSRMF